MSEHKQPEYEKEETMKKNQIRKSVAALAMAAVVGVSLLGYGCGSKSASTAGGVSGDFTGTAKGMGGDVTVTLTLEDGRKVDWRDELANKLISIQKSDGSWVNTNNRWWEADPVLVTSYCVLALEQLYHSIPR